MLAIASDLFRNNTNIQTVTIDADVTTIPSGVFSGCNSLTSVTLPDTVTSIEEEAFPDTEMSYIYKGQKYTKLSDVLSAIANNHPSAGG